MSETVHVSETIKLSHQALLSVVKYRAKDGIPFNAASRMIETNDTIVITGVGKSLIVAEMAASLLRSVNVRAIACHATDLLHGDMNFLPKSGGVLIAITHSGRTPEVVAALEVARERETYRILISSKDRSPCAQLASSWLRYEVPVDGSKHGTIPTASVTAQLAWINELVVSIADGVNNHDLYAGHRSGALSLTYAERIIT